MVERMSNDISIWLTDFIALIEDGYISMSTSIEYRHFWIQMSKIGNMERNDLEQNSKTDAKDSLLRDYRPMLKFESKIICAQWICNRIIEDFDKKQFEAFITKNLIAYFGSANANPSDEKLLFSVETDSDALLVQTLEEEESPPYVFYAIASISGTLVVIGIFAFLFNKMPSKCSKIPGFNIVDDGKWTAMIIFGLQFWYE